VLAGVLSASAVS